MIENTHTVCSQMPDLQLETRRFEIQRYLRELELIRTDLVTDFLNPENRSFEKVSIVTFK